ERPVPAGFPDLRPAVREPERGIAIAAGLDELAELAVRDEAARERVRPEQHLVARRLVVEAEIPAVAADLEHSARVADEAKRRGLALGRLGQRRVGRSERVREERLLHV